MGLLGLRGAICSSWKVHWSSHLFCCSPFHKTFSSSGPHCCVTAGMAQVVSVCVFPLSHGRRAAPCCDYVYCFVTLRAALPTANNWHWHRMERAGWRTGRGGGVREKTDREHEQSWLISCSFSPSLYLSLSQTLISCYGSKQNIWSQNMLFNFSPTLPLWSWTALCSPVAGLAATGLGAGTLLSESITVMQRCGLELS